MSWNPAAMYTVGSLLPTLGTTIVAARFGVRIKTRSPLKADDWTAFVSMLGMWGMAGIILAGTARGWLGTHTAVDPITHKNIVTSKDSRNVQMEWVLCNFLYFTLGSIKISIVLLYRRIFESSPRFNLYTAVLGSLIVCWSLSFLLANIFQCGIRPWAYWTSHKTLATYCIDGDHITVGFALSDLIIDFMILLAPMPIIWMLHMSRTEKLEVTTLFAMGFLSTAVCVARTYIMLRNAYHSSVGHRDISGRFLFLAILPCSGITTYMLAINSEHTAWSLIYAVAAIVAGCLPTMKPLLKWSGVGHFFRNIFSLFLNRSPSSDNHSDEGMFAMESIGGTAFGGDKNKKKRSAHNPYSVNISTQDSERNYVP